jgi:hypothetical protein
MMFVSVVAIGVIVQASQDNGSTGRTTGGGAEGVGEEGTVFGQRIQVWRFDDRVSVAAGVLSLIVSHEKDDVPLGREQTRNEEICNDSK